MPKALFADTVSQTDCCGLFEVAGLEVAEVEEEDGFGQNWNYRGKQDTLREVMKKEAESEFGKPSGGRGFLATTVGDQRAEIRELKKLGFKRLARWKNNNTGNYVTMWFKVQKGKRNVRTQ